MVEFLLVPSARADDISGLFVVDMVEEAVRFTTADHLADECRGLIPSFCPNLNFRL